MMGVYQILKNQTTWLFTDANELTVRVRVTHVDNVGEIAKLSRY